MKDAVRQRARELGFDDCRFTTAAAPDSREHFQRWLAAGQHGEMGYLARNAHKRVDPELVLASARTVICLAVSYEEADWANAEQRPRCEPSPFAERGEKVAAGRMRRVSHQRRRTKPLTPTLSPHPMKGEGAEAQALRRDSTESYWEMV